MVFGQAGFARTPGGSPGNSDYSTPGVEATRSQASSFKIGAVFTATVRASEMVLEREQRIVLGLTGVVAVNVFGGLLVLGHLDFIPKERRIFQVLFEQLLQAGRVLGVIGNHLVVDVTQMQRAVV